MKKLLPAFIAFICTSAYADTVETTTADILNNKGETIGKVSLEDGGNGTLGKIEIGKSGLTPGWHAVHFHAVGDCSDHDAFKHSMAHINDSNKQHGLLNKDGFEEGDLTNIFANEDGSANAEFFAAGLRLKSGDKPIMDTNGSALLIHENPDDHITQPIGNAGSRIACGVIK